MGGGFFFPTRAGVRKAGHGGWDDWHRDAEPGGAWWQQVVAPR